MMRRLWNALKTRPGRILLGVAVVIGVVDAAFAASTLINQRNARDLGVQVLALQESLDQLRQVEQEGLEGLAAEAKEAEAELATLRAGFPKLGEPFDLFRRGFSLAASHQVEIERVDRGSSVLEETPVGYLSITAYTLRSTAELADCLAYTGSLEQAGLETLALDNMTMAPGDQRCDFQVILASAAPAPPESVELSETE